MKAFDQLSQSFSSRMGVVDVQNVLNPLLWLSIIALIGGGRLRFYFATCQR